MGLFEYSAMKRNTIKKTIIINGKKISKTSRPMTEAEEKVFDHAFELMDESFDKMAEVFRELEDLDV